ncbi:MAG: hypothetical protein IJC09_04400 [Clostridia bacterium]|nr:hypothetical protein [Clostridia bacterium]
MKYNIADIIVDFDVQYPRLKRQIEDYKYDGDRKTNVKIRFEDQFFKGRLIDFPHLDCDTIEYMFLGAEYYTALVHFNGMMLHSSCVVYDGKAYLFSAPSGTGKSTHTQLWLKRFPGSYILNDDKPAIRITENGIYAYGTPFSGKTDLNVNTGVPIGGICVIERSETNKIETLPTDEALFSIMNQTVRPSKEDEMDKMLDTLDKVVSNVPVYRLSCNMELSAAEVAYNGMKG